VRFSNSVPVPAAFIQVSEFAPRFGLGAMPKENTFRTGRAQQGVNDEAYDDFVGMPNQHAAMKGSAR
jgi:hypothetical protein